MYLKHKKECLKMNEKADKPAWVHEVNSHLTSFKKNTQIDFFKKNFYNSLKRMEKKRKNKMEMKNKAQKSLMKFSYRKSGPIYKLTKGNRVGLSYNLPESVVRTFTSSKTSNKKKRKKKSRPANDRQLADRPDDRPALAAQQLQKGLQVSQEEADPQAPQVAEKKPGFGATFEAQLELLEGLLGLLDQAEDFADDKEQVVEFEPGGDQSARGAEELREAAEQLLHFVESFREGKCADLSLSRWEGVFKGVAGGRVPGAGPCG